MNSLLKGCTSFRDLGILGLSFEVLAEVLGLTFLDYKPPRGSERGFSVNPERLLLIAVNRERENLFLVIREQT